MRELELALRALQAANLATPAVIAIFNVVRSGLSEGKTDDEILAHAESVALETRDITTRDMSSEP